MAYKRYYNEEAESDNTYKSFYDRTEPTEGAARTQKDTRFPTSVTPDIAEKLAALDVKEPKKEVAKAPAGEIDKSRLLEGMAYKTPTPIEPKESLLKRYQAWSASTGRKIARGQQDIAAGGIHTLSSLASGADYLGVPKASELAETFDKWADPLIPENATFVDNLLQGVGSSATFFIPGIGIGKMAQAISFVGPKLAILFGYSASTALEALSEAGSVYKTNLDDGKSEDQANSMATRTFWANALVIGITNRFTMGGEALGLLKKGLLSAPVEGFQEGAQQIISNLATGRPWDEGVGESVAIGAIIGPFLGIGAELSYNQRQTGTQVGNVKLPTPAPKGPPKDGGPKLPPAAKEALKEDIKEALKEGTPAIEIAKEVAQTTGVETNTAISVVDEAIKDTIEEPVAPVTTTPATEDITAALKAIEQEVRKTGTKDVSELEKVAEKVTEKESSDTVTLEQLQELLKESESPEAFKQTIEDRYDDTNKIIEKFKETGATSFEEFYEQGGLPKTEEAVDITTAAKKADSFEGWLDILKSLQPKAIVDGVVDWTKFGVDAKLIELYGESAEDMFKIIKEGKEVEATTPKSKEVDKPLETKDNKDNEGKPSSKDTGRDVDEGKSSTPVSVGPEEPAGPRTDDKKPGREPRSTKQPGSDTRDTGERPGAPVTSEPNEVIKKDLESVTTVSEGGEVTISGEVTEEIKERANQYETGGVKKEGRGILDEYYTNSKIVTLVEVLLEKTIGEPISGKVLEPSIGAGNFLYAVPESVRGDVVGYEINPESAKIAKVFHPEATIKVAPFESLFMDESGKAVDHPTDFSYVIGNPPYGEHRGKYLGLGEESKIKKYEDYFLKRGMDVLELNGTMAMVVPSGFLNRKTNYAKEEIAKQGRLINAFRLPKGVFEGTEIGVDIVVFQKAPLDKKLDSLDRLEFTKRLSDMSEGKFFKKYPDNILGEETEVKNRFGKMETVVTGTLDDALALFEQNKDNIEVRELMERQEIDQEDAAAIVKETKNKETQDELAKEKKKQDDETAKKQAKDAVKVTKTVKKEHVKTKIAPPKEYSATELTLWEKAQPGGIVALTEEELKNADIAAAVNKTNSGWMLDFFYQSGDIYGKLSELEQLKSDGAVTDKQYEAQKKKLDAVLPAQEDITELTLPPNLGFVRKLEIEDGKTITDTFTRWLTDLPREAFEQSGLYEVSEYIMNKPVRGNDKDYNQRVRERRKRVGNKLFKKYLETLNDTQTAIVIDAYNKHYNGYHIPNYADVPLFSEISDTFKGKKFELRDAQRAGVGRLVANGVGILAHDVGFGKTLSGAIAVHETMKKGWAKKPLIVVPSQQHASQWIAEMQDIIPDVKINNLGNLGVNFAKDLSKLEIREGEITLIDYKGLEALSFNELTYKSLSSKFAYIADDLKKHKSERDKEKHKAGIEEIAGRMQKGARKDVNFEKLGFDLAMFDEVHNLNHVLSKVKLDKSIASDFRQFTQRPSSRGMNAWIVAQYIQDRNGGRNVYGLSATPFTNHPLEYYSVLSMFADGELSRMGFRNVNEFFTTFMDTEQQYEFKANGAYEHKVDVRGFINYRQFKKLLNAFIDFRDGAESGIVRPERHQRDWYIPQTEFALEQEAQAKKLFNDRNAQAGALTAIGQLKEIALSPYLSPYYTGEQPDYKEFVENSPKLHTTMELIRQNKKDNSKATQIVYAEYGIEVFPILKKYLIKELGYKESEVAIVAGDKGGGVSAAKRPDVQDKFNKGEIKVLLGSQTIKEGINLQERTSDMYILTLPWNFTQLRQIIGRAWRHGNMWKNIRINNMYIENSVDVFTAQKLKNKQDRYESTIQAEGQEVDVGDIDWNDMRFDLVTDPEIRAKLEISAREEELEMQIDSERSELALSTRRIDKLAELEEEIKDNEERLEKAKKEFEEEQATNEEDADDFWVRRYQEGLSKAKKRRGELLKGLQERGIDVEELQRIKARGIAKIGELEKELEDLSGSHKERVAELIATMPEVRYWSDEILQEMIKERVEDNKSFYVVRAAKPASAVKVQPKKTEPLVVTQEVAKEQPKTKKKRVVKKKKKSAPKRTLEIIYDTKMEVSEKIEKLLDIKQEGKEYKDSGERVTGSKKENATIRTIQKYGSKELNDKMIDAVGARVIADTLTKDTILEDIEKPTVDNQKAAGIPAAVADYKVGIWNTITKTPRLEEKRGKWRTITFVHTNEEKDFVSQYPALLQNFAKDIVGIKTFDDISEFSNKYRYNFTDENFTTIVSTFADGKITEAREKKELDIGVIGKNMQNKLVSTPNSRHARFVLLKKAHEEEGVWKDGDIYRYIHPTHYGLPGVYTAKSEAEAVKAFKDAVARVEKTPRQVLAEVADTIASEKKELYDSYETWPNLKDKKKKDTKDIDLSHGNFGAIDKYDVGDDRIPQSKVTAQRLQDTYGFKSVQFGNYMDDTSSKEHIQQTMGAIEDMSVILGVDLPKVIKNNNLSMAFGARGGGRFLAHYEPTKNIINLTKKRGDGSFGHEFMHFMDEKVGRIYRGKWSAKGGNWGRHNDNLDRNTLILNRALTSGVDIAKTEKFTPSDTFNPDAPGYYERTLMAKKEDGKTFEEALTEAKGTYRYLQAVADIYRKTFDADVTVKSNRYYQDSAALGGSNSYWVRNHELWARAFQAYLHDKMTEKKQFNQYATRPVEDNADVPSFYPTGKERQAFNKLFDDVFSELATKYPLPKEGLDLSDDRFNKTDDKAQPAFQVSSRQLASELTGTGVVAAPTISAQIAYLKAASERLGVDIPYEEVHKIFTGEGLETAYGATWKNKIFLDKNDISHDTAYHEMMELIMTSPDLFKGVTSREEVLRVLTAANGGVKPTAKSISDVRHKVIERGVDYVANNNKKGLPQVIIDFFEKVKMVMARVWGAFGGKTDIINSFIRTTAYARVNRTRPMVVPTSELDYDSVTTAYTNGLRTLDFSRLSNQSAVREFIGVSAYFQRNYVRDEKGRFTEKPVLVSPSVLDRQPQDIQQAYKQFIEPRLSEIPIKHPGESYIYFSGHDGGTNEYVDLSLINQLKRYNWSDIKIMAVPNSMLKSTGINERDLNGERKLVEQVSFQKKKDLITLNAAQKRLYDEGQAALIDLSHGLITEEQAEQKIANIMKKLKASMTVEQKAAFSGSDNDAGLRITFETTKPSFQTKTFIKKVKKGVKPFTLTTETKKESVERLIVNVNTRIKVIQEQLEKQGANVNEDIDVFMHKTLLPRKIGNLFRNFELRKKEFVAGLYEDGLTLEDIDLYAYALHAPTRNKLMKSRDFEGDNGSGITDKQAKEILAKLETEGKTERLEVHREKLRQIQRDTLALDVTYGLRTLDEVKAIVSVYGPDYVPLSREFSDESGIGMGIGKGVDIRGKESKRAKGSQREILPITAQIMNQHSKAFIRGEKNKVGRILYEFIQQNNKNGEMSGLFTVEKQQYIPRFDKNGELLYMDPKYKLGDGTIGVKIDGKQYYITIHDKKLARAIKETHMHQGFATSAMFVRYLSSMITQYSPEFMLRNAQRDFFEGMINLKEIKELEVSDEQKKNLTRDAGLATPKIIKEMYRYKRGKVSEMAGLFDRFEQAGGEVGYFWTVDAIEQMKSLEKMYNEAEGKGMDGLKNVIKKGGDYVSAANTAVELGVRVSIFNELTKRGMSDKKAAVVAGDITVDFNRVGEWGPFMKSLYVFINPAIQGPHRVYRAVTRSKAVRRATLGMVLAGFVNGILSQMLGGDDDDNIAEYKKNTRIIFATPSGNEVTVFFLPYGYNAFWALGRNMSEMVMGKKDALETVGDTLMAAADSFNPMGGSRFSLTETAPSLIKPIAEISLNQGWYGAPIAPEQPPYQPNIPNHQRYWDSASELSVTMARLLNVATGGNERESGLIDVSPEHLDYAARQYTGSVGTLFLETLSLIQAPFSDREVQPSQIPIISDYYSEINSKRAKQNIVFPMLEDSRRVDFGELQTQRYYEALTTLVAKGDMAPDFASSMREDFRENQHWLQSGETLEKTRLRKVIEDVNGGADIAETFEDAVKDLKGNKYSSQDYTTLKKELRVYQEFGFDDNVVNELLGAYKNSDKLEILLQYRKDEGDKAFRDLVNRGRKETTTKSGRLTEILISDALMELIKDNI